ncbi:transposase [Kamptonema animale CS-326]|jgi:putative transposase|uniref:RNA-guided endonuclease InsQ/TnpB family protein n=1 Tax=Kamptonema animale TaxID=92934 RepID=UPI00232BC478|nr:transposase [Kamptonema animale]MDB9512639.1 transposase [Kamptonema animale CS-326]
MLVLEAKLRGKNWQYELLEETIRTANFVRNKALRHWMDNRGVGKNDLQKLCATLAKEYDWAGKLNSQARQSSADRAWNGISRFYANCKEGKPGKKGYPKFKKRGRSVEYKQTGWKLAEDRKRITFTDGFKAGTFKLLGTRDLNFYHPKQIKRVRVVKRADGFYCQFLIDVERTEPQSPTGKTVGIDLGLEFFYTDSEGNQIENPRFLRKSEKSLKRLQRRVSKRKKGSKNRKKAINKMARKHLKVSRQRREFAVKTARALVVSNDTIVYEDLKVSNMVKNHKLGLSISDAAWSMFTNWVDYFAKIRGVHVVAVSPHFTSQDCSRCGTRVKKYLSTRTHKCPSCGLVEHRDLNAARNILAKGLGIESTVGHIETQTLEEIEPLACSEQSGRVKFGH